MNIMVPELAVSTKQKDNSKWYCDHIMQGVTNWQYEMLEYRCYRLTCGKSDILLAAMERDVIPQPTCWEPKKSRRPESNNFTASSWIFAVP